MTDEQGTDVPDEVSPEPVVPEPVDEAPVAEPAGVDPVARRSGRRGRIARIASGLGVLVLAGAVAATGYAAPIPADVAVTARTVEVAPAARTLICAGAVAVAGEGAVGSDAAFDPTPVDTLTELRAVSVAGGAGGSSSTGASRSAADGAAPSGTLSPLTGGKAAHTLGPDGSSAQSLRAAGEEGAMVLRVDPVGDVPPLAAGASASLTTAGDLRGLAAASCQQPAQDLWLVGGSTELGASARLVIANSGATAAEVTLEVFGPSGALDLGGSTQLLVAPGAQSALLLEGVAAEQKRIVVHVRAAGGLVTAHVQDSRLNGFTPEGVDLVSPGSAPSTRQVVAGIVVPGSAIDDPDAAVLRMLVPGKVGTTARLSLLGPTGVITLPGADSLDLAAGEVTDVSLGGLPAGAYTAVVDASAPVVAGAMITRAGLPGELDDTPTLERAWSASAAPGLGGLVALPARVAGTVVVAAVGTEPDGSGGLPGVGTLRVIGSTGEILAELPVDLPAGRTLTVPLIPLAGTSTVAGVELVLPDAAGGSAGSAATALSWTLLATVAAADGELVSVITPVSPAEAPPTVAVRRAVRDAQG